MEIGHQIGGFDRLRKISAEGLELRLFGRKRRTADFVKLGLGEVERILVA